MHTQHRELAVVGFICSRCTVCTRRGEDTGPVNGKIVCRLFMASPWIGSGRLCLASGPMAIALRSHFLCLCCPKTVTIAAKPKKNSNRRIRLIRRARARSRHNRTDEMNGEGYKRVRRFEKTHRRCGLIGRVVVVRGALCWSVCHVCALVFCNRHSNCIWHEAHLRHIYGTKPNTLYTLNN